MDLGSPLGGCHRLPISKGKWGCKLKKFIVFVVALSFLMPLSQTPRASAAGSCTPTTTTSSGYIVNSFTSVGTCTWTVPVGITSVDLLVVSGGGGGGWNSGGGGAGGGVVAATAQPVGATANIVVGAGGIGGGLVVANQPGVGGQSYFDSITVAGGSAGTNFNAATYPMAGGAAINGRGGGGIGSTNGATGHGTKADGGPGDTGVASTITGTLYYYGGGGGGGGWSGAGNPYGGAGGASGGGKGSDGASVGTAGAANSGGGGGASGDSGYYGGAGGSGVVIVRYPMGAGDFTTGKNSNGTYRTAIPLSVTIQSASKVTFFANGKRIPGCIKVATSGSGPYTASCNWRPSTHNRVPVTASVSPNASPGSLVTLSAGSLGVSSRSNNR